MFPSLWRRCGKCSCAICRTSSLAITFRHDREEVLGQSFNFLMARGADPEALAEIEAAFEGSSDSDPEIRYRRKDGSEFWAFIFVSRVE